MYCHEELHWSGGLEKACTEAIKGRRVQECVEGGTGALMASDMQAELSHISHSSGTEAGEVEPFPQGVHTAVSFAD